MAGPPVTVGTNRVDVNYVCIDIAGVQARTGPAAAVVETGPQYGVTAAGYYQIGTSNNFTGANEVLVAPNAGFAGCAVNLGAPTSPCEVPGVFADPVPTVRILGTRYI